jgi:hypothetical protein
MRTLSVMVVITGVGVGAVLLALGQAATPQVEGHSESAYRLIVAAMAVWAFTPVAVWACRRPEAKRLWPTAVTLVGIAVTAAVLGLAAHVAKNPGFTTDCVRDGVAPHHIACYNRIRDYASADDRALWIAKRGSGAESPMVRA